LTRCDMSDTATNLPFGMLTRFRTICTAQACYETGAFTELLARYRIVPSSSRDEAMCTWLPAQHIPLLLVSLEGSRTAVYIVSTSEMFHARSEISLMNAPVGTVVRCNYTEDDLEDGVRSPRVLCFDVLRHGDDNLASLSAFERYTLLRETCVTYLTSALFTLQWVGYYKYARDMLKGSVNVGHKIGGLIALDADPSRHCVPLTLKLPEVDQLPRWRVFSVPKENSNKRKYSICNR
jgi:hypothetical protein